MRSGAASLALLLAASASGSLAERVFLPEGVQFTDLRRLHVTNPFGRVTVNEGSPGFQTSITNPDGAKSTYSLVVNDDLARLNVLSAEDAAEMTVQVDLPRGTCYGETVSGQGVTLTIAACAETDSDAKRPGRAGSDAPSTVGDSPFAPEFTDLSEAKFDIAPVEVIQVPTTTDGKRMYNAVYRPKTNEKVPVYINFSPYWGDSATANGDAFGNYLINEFVPRGFAVVLTAVRGTGKSEGCFEIGSDTEVQDLHDMIDFFSKTTWSNGRVGMGGKSYDSSPGNGVVAKMPHPALKFVFHVSGITDMYRYNYQNGVPYVNGLAFNARFGFTQGLDEYVAGPGDEDAQSLLRLLDDVNCPEQVGIQTSGLVGAFTGLRDDYWIERDWNRYLADSDWEGAYFFYHGLFDYNVKPDHILPWVNNFNTDKVDLTVWLHQDRQNIGHLYPAQNDWNSTFVAMLDTHLKEKEVGLDQVQKVRAQANPTYEWYYSPNWGLEKDTEFTEFKGFPSLVAPVLTVDPEATSTRISGEPIATISVSSLNPDAVVSAILYDVDPSGSRIYVTEGARRVLLRDNLEYVSTYLPGQPLKVDVPLFPVEHVLRPGHTLLVDFQASPSESLVLPTQRIGVTVDPLTSVLSIPLRGEEDKLTFQPEFDQFGIDIS